MATGETSTVLRRSCRGTANRTEQMPGTGAIPFTYLSLSQLFTGIALFGFVRLIYIYHKTRDRLILTHTLINASFFIYMLSDSISLIMLLNDNYCVHLVLTRKLMLTAFPAAAAILVHQSIALSPMIKRINIILLIAAGFLFAAFTAIGLISPGLITGASSAADNLMEAAPALHQATPLFLFMISTVTLYLFYTAGVFSYAAAAGITHADQKKFIYSLYTLVYFALTGMFILLFFSSSSFFLSSYYPHTSAGMAAFIIINSFGLTDIYMDNARQLEKVKINYEKNLYSDRLTGLNNRGKFLADMKRLLPALQEKNETSTLFFLDIDNFQDINESFGEHTGDELLKAFSRRISGRGGRGAELYRIGGDDFVLLIRHYISAQDAVSLANGIIASLRNPFLFSGMSYMVTSSIAIMHIPRDGDTPDRILQNAYSVLRQAKRHKNTYLEFNSGTLHSTSERIRAVNILRSSIAEDRFALHYQAIVDSSGKPFYAETLLRCTNPDPSIGGPGSFIPLLEKAGLMKEVDNMVLRKAFYDLEMRLKKRIGISINLSSSQLVDPEYCVFISDFAAQHGISTELIVLEVVENTLIENLTAGRDNIRTLKEMGFRIAIDDFGKGFSSLSYLSELPVDILKLDMDFTRSIPGDPRNAQISEHIVRLAHSLGLTVVIEGVEHQEQLDFFSRLGCDHFQGYLFSRPLPIQDFIGKYLIASS